MGEPTQVTRIEPRWLVGLTVVAVFCLLILLPDRLKTFPSWVAWIIVLNLLIPMAGLELGTAKMRWLRIERVALAIFIPCAGIALLANLRSILAQMLHHSGEISAVTLLDSSLAVWATNVLIFSLWYWRMDRGGPEARANQASTKPDWQFPQDSLRDTEGSNWHPTFVDYLFLGFVTATAFSPTDVLPLTSRAKLLMMLESTISLVTIVTVAARAINTLGQ